MRPLPLSPSPPPRARRHLLLAAAAAAAFAPAARADCFDSCIFSAYNKTDGSVLYTWDLRSLCNNGSGYSFTNITTNWLFRFEICGSLDPVVPTLPPFVGDGSLQGQVVGSVQTNTYCNPEYNAYPNTGNFLQFFDPNPERTCYYGPTSGTPAPAVPGSTPYGGCPFTGTVGKCAAPHAARAPHCIRRCTHVLNARFGWARPLTFSLAPRHPASTAGAMNLPNLCCTGYCAVLSSSSRTSSYRWINNNNIATGGIRWTEYGNNADSADEFQCPIDPNTGYPRSRMVLVNMYCHPDGKITDPLVVNSVWETSDCVYRAEMTHFLACGVPANSSGGCSGGNSSSGGSSGNCSCGGNSSSSGGNSQMDITAAAPILEVGYSVGFVVAGAIAALAAVFVAQQVRARCGPCRLPRVTISFKYDDDNEGAGLSRSATLAGAYASTSATPLRGEGQ